MLGVLIRVWRFIAWYNPVTQYHLRHAPKIAADVAEAHVRERMGW